MNDTPELRDAFLAELKRMDVSVIGSHITHNNDGTVTVTLANGFQHEGRLNQTLTMRLATFGDELAVPMQEPPLRGYHFLSYLYAPCMVPPLTQPQLVQGLLGGADFDRLFDAQELLQKKRASLPTT